MIAFPSGARVWLATGHTDMRKGFGSLALMGRTPDWRMHASSGRSCRMKLGSSRTDTPRRRHAKSV